MASGDKVFRTRWILLPPIFPYSSKLAKTTKNYYDFVKNSKIYFWNCGEFHIFKRLLYSSPYQPFEQTSPLFLKVLHRHDFIIDLRIEQEVVRPEFICIGNLIFFSLPHNKSDKNEVFVSTGLLGAFERIFQAKLVPTLLGRSKNTNVEGSRKRNVGEVKLKLLSNFACLAEMCSSVS